MKGKRFLMLPVLLLLGANVVKGQQHGIETEDKKLSDIFGKAHFHGHIRNYFMSTLNEGELTDYYTNATGGAIAIRTSNWKGFEAGVKGIFTYRTFSSDLNRADPTVGEMARWEFELYDITDPHNFNDLDRLEELYITYRFHSGYITYGKMEIQNTPLLNESDERMKPFAFNGSWLYWQPAVEHRLNAAWINRVSPRSTVEWYDFNEAIGLENNGYLPNGDPAEYHEKTGSNGIALLNYSYSIDAFSLEFHEWYLDRIMNTLWLQAVFEKNNWFGGLQYLYQWPLEQQRDLPEPDRYVQPGENGQVISMNAGMSDRGYAVSLSFSHAFDSGRFLFPRELGRDRVFTSVPRSRLEGFGDVDVLTLRGDFYPGRVRNLNLGLDFTRVFGAEADNFVFNKYGKDEYYQVNSRLHYDFKGFLKNLELDLLYVYKWNVNEISPDVIFNHSNFHQVNLVTNFNF